MGVREWESLKEAYKCIFGLDAKVSDMEMSAQPADSKPLLAQIPMLPIRRDSMEDQLNDLYGVALRLGMNDACEWLISKGIHRGER